MLSTNSSANQKKEPLIDHLQINNNVITFPANQNVNFNRSVGKAVFDQMLINKNRMAQVDGLTGKEDSYNYLLLKCIRVALVMRSKGVVAGDLIVCCTKNHLNTYVPAVAALFLGAKVLYIDPAVPLSECTHILGKVTPKLMFVAQNGYKLINQAKTQIEFKWKTYLLPNNDTEFGEFLVESKEERTFTPVTVDSGETAVMLLSSGTTGFSKIVCHSHVTVMKRITAVMPSTSDSRLNQLLYFSPSGNGGVVTALGSFHVGNRVILIPDFEEPLVWNLIEKYRVLGMVISPLTVNGICKRSLTPRRTSSLRCVWLSGGVTPNQQIKLLQTLLPEVFIMQAFGATEFGGGILSFQFYFFSETLKLLYENPASCGRPMEGYSYKIADLDSRKALGPNQLGELCIKTKYQLKHYHNGDSTDTWDADGFFKTGDLAYYNNDYCFFVVDRMRHLINYKGTLIKPLELEMILLSHDDIEQAVVIGIPHTTDIEHPMGVVVLKKYATVKPNIIEEYVNSKVGEKYKLRAGVRIVDHIPETPTNKFRRTITKQMILQGKL